MKAHELETDFIALLLDQQYNIVKCQYSHDS